MACASLWLFSKAVLNMLPLAIVGSRHRGAAIVCHTTRKKTYRAALSVMNAACTSRKAVARSTPEKTSVVTP